MAGRPNPAELDTDPAPAGFPPMAGLADDMGDPRFLAAVADAARNGRLLVALTIYSVAGRRP